MKKKFYKYEGDHVSLENAEYRNNTLAVVMYTTSGEPYGNVTVNLNHPLQSDKMAFLYENNMPSIGKWIEKNGHGSYTGVKACSGCYVYPPLHV